MNDYIIEESNENEAELIIENVVNYNLSKAPKIQQQPFIWINRVIKNKEVKSLQE